MELGETVFFTNVTVKGGILVTAGRGFGFFFFWPAKASSATTTTK